MPFHRKSTIFPSKSPVCHILLFLFGFNVSAIHLGVEEVPFAHVPATKRAERPYNNQLGKRDGAMMVKRIEDVYSAIIYTDDRSAMYKVIIDTGSSYTWVGANPRNPYVEGTFGWTTGRKIEIAYIDGPFEAKEYIDSITLETTASSDTFIIDGQSIGSAIRVTKFPSQLDGILGLGRNAAPSLRGPDGNRIPTVVDNLYRQGSIRYAAFGVYFTPLNDGGAGEITFGYYNDAVITSGLKYVPITNVPPASNYWGIDASFMYDGRSILKPASGIVDTGSNVISIPTDAILAYQSATGAIMDDGWLTITPEQYGNLQTLTVIIGGQSYDLSRNAQIHPRDLNLHDDVIYLIVDEITDEEWGFTLGHPFIQRYYVVFNETSLQIGFASTSNTGSTTN